MLVSAVSVGTLTVPAQVAPAAAAPGPMGAAVQPLQVGTLPTAKPRRDDAASKTAEPGPARVPAAGVSVVKPGAAAAGGQVVRLAPAPTGPAAPAKAARSGGAAVPAAGGAAVSSVRVQVLDAGARAKVRAQGLAFTVQRADSVTATGRAAVVVDYSSFSELHGGGWGNRLSLLRYPACVLTTPKVAGCSVATPVASVNDAVKKTLTVTTDVPAATPTATSTRTSLGAAKVAAPALAGAASVFALTSDATAEGAGSYEATKMNIASTWNVGLGSGNFSTSYPISLPDPPSGPKPTLSLDYSSQSVDGLTHAENQQSSVVGEGWDLSVPYIERTYASCKRMNSANNWGDLCWPGFKNAKLSFPGHSSTLLTDNRYPGEWRIQDDSGWRIEEKTGVANGEIDGRYFVMTTGDGTQYWFGAGHQRMGGTPGPATNSTLTVPVAAIPGQGGGWAANVGYRWYLDRVVDTHNQQATYYYAQEQNYYYSWGRNIAHQKYDSAGRLSKIEYGGGAASPNVSVRFNYERRCTANVGALTSSQDYSPTWNSCAAFPPPSGVATDQPDTPDTLVCVSTATSCDNQKQASPTFFTQYLLRQVATFVAPSSGSWQARGLDRFFYTMPDPGGSSGKSLWLRSARHYGLPSNWNWPGDTNLDPGPGGNNTGQYSLPAGTTTSPHTYFSSEGVPLESTGAPVASDTGPMQNRYDDAGTKPALKHFRIRAVSNPLGGTTYVSYSAPYCTTGTNWADNESRCFRQYYKPRKGTNGTWGIFNKYVVTKIVERDAVGGSADMVTRYMYDGKSVATSTIQASDPDQASAAWHWQDTPGNIAPVDGSNNLTLSWSDWRGYQMVTVWKGKDDTNVTKTQHRLYRGMKYDRVPSTGTCTKAATANDGRDTDYQDEPWLKGRTISVQQWDNANILRRRTVYEYRATRGAWGIINTPGTLSNTGFCGRFEGSSQFAVTNRTIESSTEGGGSSLTTTGHSHDSFGRLIAQQVNSTVEYPTTHPFGSNGGTDTAVTCSQTTYATTRSDEFTAPTVVGTPATLRSWDQSAVANPHCPDPSSTNPSTTTPQGVAFGGTDTFYDDQTSLYPSGSPTNLVPKGEPTRVDAYTSNTAKVTTRTAYDDYGRVVKVTDARGKETVTNYYATTSAGVGAAEEYPGEVVVTNPLSMTTSTSMEPRYGQALKSVDANGRETALRYDNLGRLVCVFLPKASGTGTAVPVTNAGTCNDTDGAASIAYKYFVTQDAPPEVNTRTLRVLSPMQVTPGWSFYDGFARLRQTQARSPNSSGAAMAVTHVYNDRGLKVRSTSPVHVDGANIPGVFANIGNGTADRPLDDTLTTYDEFERPTAVSVRRNEQVVTGDDGVALTTLTAYGSWGTTVAPPAMAGGLGGPTQTYLDARGKVAATRVWRTTSTTNVADAITVKQTWTPAGKLKTRTTHDGAVSTYGHDWLGRTTATTDPDAGSATASYDANGNVLQTTDAKNGKVFHTYDDLNRPTARYNGTSTAGAKLTGWVYDGTGNLGRLKEDVGYDGTRTLKRTYAYDGRARPTGITVTPDTAYGFPAASYTNTTAYNEAGDITSYTYPATGDLPAETVSYGYTSDGRSTTVTGATTYVSATAYDGRGLLQSRTYNPQGHQYSRDFTWRAGTAALARTRIYPGAVAANPTGLIQDDQFHYLGAGHQNRVVHAANNTETCYTYDGHHRLARAWTQAGNAACSAPAATAPGTGTAPMNLSYTYNKDGSPTSITDGGAGTTTTHTYYTGARSLTTHPHVPATITTGSTTQTPTVDAAGQITALDGKTFTWDVLHRLTSTTVASGAAAGTTSSAFDASNMRILRTDHTGARTLYLPGQELTTNTSGSTATRYITQGGATVAVRSAIGTRLVAADIQGTPQISVVPATGAVTRRWATPYGAERTTTGTTGFLGQRRFLDHVQDDTGVLDDAARSYLPSATLFLSPDPLATLAPPAATSPYNYGYGNPITLSDPSGLEPRPWHNPNYDKVPQKDKDKYVTSRGGYEETREQRRERISPPPRASYVGRAMNDPNNDTADPVNPYAIGIHPEYTHYVVPNQTKTHNVSDSQMAHGVLAVAGMIPVIGEPADALDAILYAVEGDWVNATIALSGTVPVVGTGSGAKRLLGLSAKTCSFSGATPVLMADGTKTPIQDIKPGDKVIATDPESGERLAKSVEQVFVHQDDLLNIRVDGELITTTEDHPFWSVKDQRFKPAGELATGDSVLSAAGQVLPVSRLGVVGRHVALAYNLSVEGIHTYHVGSAAILVHNACNPGGAANFKGLSLNQVKKHLKQRGQDPHSFKEEFVGRTAVSRFDIKSGPSGELYLVSKDGSVVIPTGFIPKG